MKDTSGRLVVGVDETGRGSCFGPVITCALVFPLSGLPSGLLGRLDDSKAMTARQRAAVAAELETYARYALGAASADEVVRLNPLRATMLAMARAVRRLAPDPEAYVIVDGPYMPDIAHDGEALIGADSKVPQVMAASIVAKEKRDAAIRRLAVLHSGYGLERHAGYGTKSHFAAIAELGPTKHHRSTFIRKPMAARAQIALSAAPNQAHDGATID